VPRPEARLAPIALRGLVLAGLVLLAATPAYVFVEPPWRPPLARLAVALVLGVMLLQLRGALAALVVPDGASMLEAGRDRVPLPPAVPQRLQEMMEDVRAARRSRRHFERILWPRLTALASRPLTPPPPRPGRGPGLTALRRVIAEAERQP
jgi:hypothetical protein